MATRLFASRLSLRASHFTSPSPSPISKLTPRVIPGVTTRIIISPLGITRTMASSTPARKFDFLVILPDKPDALPRRLEARPQHFEGIPSKVQDGTYKLGGALLKDVPKDDEVSSLDFYGSTLVINAESKDAVIAMLKDDPYTKADVWDWDKVQIYPFRPAWKTTAHM